MLSFITLLECIISFSMIILVIMLFYFFFIHIAYELFHLLKTFGTALKLLLVLLVVK